MRLKILGVFVPFFLIFSSVSVYASVRCDGVLPDTSNAELTISYNSDCTRNFQYKSYVVERLATLAWGKANCSFAQGVWNSSDFSIDWDYGVYKKVNTQTHYLYGVRFSVVSLDPQNTDTDGDGVKDFFDSEPNNPSVSDLYDPGSDDDGDGVYNCIDQCPNTPNNISVDSVGCPDPCVDNDGDGIPYAFDENVGMQDDYYFRYTTYQNSSGQITGYSFFNENSGTWKKLGNPDPINELGFVSGRYHSSKIFEHFDCNEFTFNKNEKVSPGEGADFQDDFDKNAPGVDQESDPEIDPSDGDGDGDGENDGSGSGNYATREDAAAIEGAIKESSRILRQDGEATRYSINKGFSDTGQKINKTNQILDGILKNTENFDVDTTGLETKLDDIINQDLEYQNFVKDKFEDFGNISAEKLSDFENVSVEDYYNSEKFSGELIEGEDFDSIIPLSDQTFIQDFLSNNPVLSALSSSKIETQNSKCDFILVTSLGAHEMDLCFLESGFNKAGLILLSLTSLFSLFVVVKK